MPVRHSPLTGPSWKELSLQFSSFFFLRNSWRTHKHACVWLVLSDTESIHREDSHFSSGVPLSLSEVLRASAVSFSEKGKNALWKVTDFNPFNTDQEKDDNWLTFTRRVNCTCCFWSLWFIWTQNRALPWTKFFLFFWSYDCFSLPPKDATFKSVVSMKIILRVKKKMQSTWTAGSRKESTFSARKAQGEKLMQRSGTRLNSADNQNRASNGNVIITGCKWFNSLWLQACWNYTPAACLDSEWRFSLRPVAATPWSNATGAAASIYL